jgi:hypothetical protein
MKTKKSLRCCRSAGFQPAIPLGSSKSGKMPALRRASRMKTTCLLLLVLCPLARAGAFPLAEAVLCPLPRAASESSETAGPLPRGEGVARPAFSPAGARRVRGHSHPASQNVNRRKPLPSTRSTLGNAMNLHQPGLDKPGGAAKSGFIRNETVNNALAVRTPSVIRPTVPSLDNVRHRGLNPAVVGGSPNSHRRNTGAIDGTRMNRKP